MAALFVGCACGQRFKARPELVGQTVGCPSCGQPLVVKCKSTADALASQNPLDLGSVDAWNDPLSSVDAYSPASRTLSTLRPSRPASKPFPVKTVAWIVGGGMALALIVFVLVYAGKAIHAAYHKSVANAERTLSTNDSSEDGSEEPKATGKGPRTGTSHGDSTKAARIPEERDGASVLNRAVSTAVDAVTPDLRTPTGVYKHSIYLAQQGRFEDLYDLYPKDTQAFFDSHAAAEGYENGREYFGAVMAKMGRRLNYVCANPQFEEKRSGNRCTLTVTRNDGGVFLQIDPRFIREGAFWKFDVKDPRGLLEFAKQLEEIAAKEKRRQPEEPRQGR